MECTELLAGAHCLDDQQMTSQNKQHKGTQHTKYCRQKENQKTRCGILLQMLLMAAKILDSDRKTFKGGNWLPGCIKFCPSVHLLTVTRQLMFGATTTQVRKVNGCSSLCNSQIEWNISNECVPLLTMHGCGYQCWSTQNSSLEALAWDSLKTLWYQENPHTATSTRKLQITQNLKAYVSGAMPSSHRLTSAYTWRKA